MSTCAKHGDYSVFCRACDLDAVAAHPMTDIDAIRKAKRYDSDLRNACCGRMAEAVDGAYVLAADLDSVLAAYDAKCEELAEAYKDAAEQNVRCACEFDSSNPNCGIEPPKVECFYHTELRAERDDLRMKLERAAGVVEAKNVQLAAVSAERDAAVRDAIGLRAALRKYGEHDRTCQHRQYLGLEFGLKAVCSCGYEAALAPPTEQQKVAT